jgi:hypothetical protein
MWRPCIAAAGQPSVDQTANRTPAMDHQDFKTSRTARLLLVLACVLSLGALQPETEPARPAATAQTGAGLSTVR